MKKKKMGKMLSEKDREFILMFFNMVLKFKEPKNEFDIDAHLKDNYNLFFIFCDFLIKNKTRYEDMQYRLYSLEESRAKKKLKKPITE